MWRICCCCCNLFLWFRSMLLILLKVVCACLWCCCWKNRLGEKQVAIVTIHIMRQIQIPLCSTPLHDFICTKVWRPRDSAGGWLSARNGRGRAGGCGCGCHHGCCCRSCCGELHLLLLGANAFVYFVVFAAEGAAAVCWAASAVTSIIARSHKYACVRYCHYWSDQWSIWGKSIWENDRFCFKNEKWVCFSSWCVLATAAKFVQLLRNEHFCNKQLLTDVAAGCAQDNCLRMGEVEWIQQHDACFSLNNELAGWGRGGASLWTVRCVFSTT